MYRTVTDFLSEWNDSADGTANVINNLTDDKLDQAIVEGHSTLGWLGWHLVNSPAFFGKLAGLDIDLSHDPDRVPTKAQDIAEAYNDMAQIVKEQVEQQLTDESLNEKVDSFGTPIPRGAILRKMIDHQTHHRGQMTVLLRQAGLSVPGVMGPTKEDQ
ncbi:hypothetical conserved protein [Oceanobacillus iheyensis HTE831]|uniref:Hypothetical conserved protein n=1 Tax=Oceanobacillus iheyensis (strain DSM 14371 / CIP 107618 / JCM 11309 / KCTC 3954 / HTE831) TaxID=221109 RepID=Q8ENT6_OCEIH|nr:DinB family protein [Oceanobacillus iheyensis]BAC14347.1 hypothetical conserved protein [Oceanobacillus iheyensis HTE831]